MQLEDHVRHKLQTKANQVLALEYDGSGDMWHYTTIGDDEYGINIWDADELGDGTKTGLCISVYPVDRNGNTIFTEWTTLKTEPLAKNTMYATF